MLHPDIPLMNSNIDPDRREELWAMLKEAKAARIWIALDRSTLFEERKEALQALSENLRFFEQKGIV